MGLKIGDVSPLGGMLTGEGMLGKAMRQGVGGAIPYAIAKNAYDVDEEEKKRAMQGVPPVKAAGMKKGGKASASKRADGIAQRGKTKGRMV